MQISFFPSAALASALEQTAADLGARFFAVSSTRQKAIGFQKPDEATWLLSGEFVQLSPTSGGPARLWFSPPPTDSARPSEAVQGLFAALRRTIKNRCVFHSESKTWVPAESEAQFRFWYAQQTSERAAAHESGMETIRQWKRDSERG